MYLCRQLGVLSVTELDCIQSWQTPEPFFFFFLQPFLIDFNVVFYQGFIVVHNSTDMSSWKLVELGTAHILWILKLISYQDVPGAMCVHSWESVCACMRVCVCVCVCVPACGHAFVCVFMHTIFIFPSVYIPWIPDKDHTQWDHPSVKTTIYVNIILYISKETNKKSKAKLTTSIQRKRRDKIKINKKLGKDCVWNRTRTQTKKCNVTLISPVLFCSVQKHSFWTFCLFWILHFQVKNVLQIGTVSVVNMCFCWFWKVVLKEEYSRCTDTDAMAKKTTDYIMTCIHQLVFAIYPLSRRNQMHSLRKTINTGYAFCVFIGVMRTLFFRDNVCNSPSLSYRWLLCNMICCEVVLSSFSFFSLSFFPPIFF